MRIERRGKVYWYLRRKGRPLIRLPDLPHDHPKFLKAYADAIGPDDAPVIAGSLARAATAAMASDRFKCLSDTYRATLRRHFDDIRKAAGSAPIRGLREHHILANATASTNPADRLKAWRFLCAHAKAIGLISTDPSLPVRLPPKPRTTGHPPWSAAEKARFRDRWNIGTVPRAAFELLNWTGFRIGDAVLIGRGHVDRQGVLVHTQSKVKEPAFVPWTSSVPAFAAHDEFERAMMLDALAAIDTGHMTFLATATGRTRSENALGTLIREAARAAGVSKSAHGLRKTRGISLAEGGGSAHQIMAWLGHQTLKEAEHYTRLASRRRAVLGAEQGGNGANPVAPGAKHLSK